MLQRHDRRALWNVLGEHVKREQFTEPEPREVYKAAFPRLLKSYFLLSGQKKRKENAQSLSAPVRRQEWEYTKTAKRKQKEKETNFWYDWFCFVANVNLKKVKKCFEVPFLVNYHSVNATIPEDISSSFKFNSKATVALHLALLMTALPPLFFPARAQCLRCCSAAHKHLWLI